ALEIGEIRREGQPLSGLQLRSGDLQGAVAARLQLRDSVRVEVEPHRLETSAELHRERQSHVAQTDDADAALAQVEHDFLPVILSKPCDVPTSREPRDSARADRSVARCSSWFGGLLTPGTAIGRPSCLVPLRASR